MKRYSLEKFYPYLNKLDPTYIVDRDSEYFLPQYNIHKGSNVPIIIYDKEGLKLIEKSTWGYKKNPYRPVHQKVDGYYPKTITKMVRRSNKENIVYFNIKLELLDEGENFHKEYINPLKRCLIPATSFFLWKDKKIKWKIDKQEYRYESVPCKFFFDEELFFFIGIILKSKGNCEHGIITTETTKSLDKFEDKIPILTDYNIGEKWLKDNDPMSSILKFSKKKYKSLYSCEVSSSVNKKSYNNKKCIICI